MVRYLFTIILFVFLLGFIINFTNLENEPDWNDIVVAEKMKGVCWVAGDSIAHNNFDDLVAVGADWISQTPFGWQSRYDEPEIRLATDHVLWGERDVGLKHTTLLARERGLKTILKPHIWVRRSEGKWRGDIQMDSEAEWNEWFDNYEKFILHYARLAEELNIEVYCIGTELHRPSTMFPDKWSELIHKVRGIYSGRITYAANFHLEYEEIKFWDELDLIGIQAYFPLIKSEHPEVGDLVNAWKKPKAKLRRLSEKYRKPVIFTEIGYTNISTAAHEPWTWPQQMVPGAVKNCDITQAYCYEAMFHSFWNEPWFGGVFIWKWFHGGYKYSMEQRNKLRQARIDSLVKAGRIRERANATFSPQGKPAEQVLKNWYQLSSDE